VPSTGRVLTCILVLVTALVRQEPDARSANEPVREVVPAEDLASGGLFAKGLVDFLGWAHPPDGRCGSVERIEVLAHWPGGLRARYEISCGGERRRLEALLSTREGQGVWQVSAGFETDQADFHAALKARVLRIPKETIPGGEAAREPADFETGAPAEVGPPPGNVPEGRDSPLDGVVSPEGRRQVSPDFPEAAGRARMIGEAHVELLVDVSPRGTPDRARLLRGPEPDLGMRRAAQEAVLRWSFSPALLRGRAVRYFAPIEITFDGLPPESRAWSHRALYDLEAVVFEDVAPAEEAVRRLRAGEPLEEVAPESALDGDWGLVPAANLPAPVRKDLHEAMIGAWVGPSPGDGKQYVTRKRGEVYYGILPSGSPSLSYQVVHQKGVPAGDQLRRALDEDILAFLAERQRRDYMNEAARLMGIRQKRTRAGQLIIHTDVLNDAEVSLLQGIVAAAFKAHQDFWAGLTTLRLFRQPVMVYAFGRRGDHQKVQQIWQGGRVSAPPATVGEYIPASRILAFPCESTAGHLPIPIAVHESIHMLNYERVYGPRGRPSKWFEEGLANYFGFSQVDGQLRIDPGAIRRSGTITAGDVRVQFDPRAELREHLRRTREEGPVALRQLLASSSDDPLWSGARSARAYGAAWTLVHFLLHGDRGRRAPAFREYAAREARGGGGPKAFEEVFGPRLDALEAAWHAYEETL